MNKTIIIGMCILGLLMLSGCSRELWLDNKEKSYCIEKGYDTFRWEVLSGCEDRDFYCVNLCEKYGENNKEGCANSTDLFVTDQEFKEWCDGGNDDN